jgi:hypothetical protein
MGFRFLGTRPALGSGFLGTGKLPKLFLLVIWDKIPGSREPVLASILRNLELIVTCFKMKEKFRLNIPMGSETHRNELLSEFRSLRTEPSRNGNSDTPSRVANTFFDLKPRWKQQRLQT